MFLKISSIVLQEVAIKIFYGEALNANSSNVDTLATFNLINYMEALESRGMSDRVRLIRIRLVWVDDQHSSSLKPRAGNTDSCCENNPLREKHGHRLVFNILPKSL
jgi:hypothetical protein